MKQLLARAIVGASALLCLLLLAGWARSHVRWDTVVWRYWTTPAARDAMERSHLLLTTTENGRLIFARALHPVPDGARQKRFAWTARAAKADGTFSASGALPGRYGFGYARFDQLYRDATMAPFWFPVVLTALLPVLALMRVSRRT